MISARLKVIGIHGQVAVRAKVVAWYFESTVNEGKATSSVMEPPSVGEFRRPGLELKMHGVSALHHSCS
jgi:hypothetical protein